MKRINIAGTSLITGTALADAVIDYWVGLVRLHRVERAEIPFIDDDGSRQSAQLVLCSAVPIWTSTVDTETVELTDTEALAGLTARTAELEPEWGLSAVEYREG